MNQKQALNTSYGAASNSKRYSTIKPKSNRLEVISEDEAGFKQTFGRNKDVVDPVALQGLSYEAPPARGGMNAVVLDNQSDASSTNAYFQRKQRIMEAIRQ